MTDTDLRLVDLAVCQHAQTGKAVLVSLAGDRADAVWLPLAHVEINRRAAGGIVEITLPEWLALEKGLI